MGKALRLALLALALSCQERVPSEKPLSPVASVQPAPSAAPLKLRGCSARELWFEKGGLVDGTVEQRRAAVVTFMAAWSSECRWRSQMEDCPRGCDDFLSGMLLDAAQSDGERLKLVRWRHDRNAESLPIGEGFAKRASELVAYANRMRPAPRSRALAKRQGQAAAGTASDEGDACLDRYRRDAERLDAFGMEVERERAAASGGADALLGLAARLRSCLDCGDDRSSCSGLATELAGYRDRLATRKKLIAADKVRLRELEAGQQRDGSPTRN